MAGSIRRTGRDRAPRISELVSGHDNNFNLIRMLAASGVLVSHAYPISLGPGSEEPLQRFLQGTTLGTVSVYVFFVVSGFFITRSFDQRQNAAAFLRARALRIYPALLMTTAATIALGAVLTVAPLNQFVSALPSFAAGTLTLFRIPVGLPGVFGTAPFPDAINGSLWTLSYEVACYGAVLLAGITGVLRHRRLTLPATALFLVFYFAAMIYDFPLRLERFADLAWPFLVGAMMWIWRDRITLSIGLAAGLWALTLLAWWTPAFKPVFVVALGYSAMITGFWMNPRLLTYNRLGDYSYGTYIYAFPVQQTVASLGVTLPLANMALALPITLIIAILSWTIIERPAQAWGRHMDRRMQRARAERNQG